MKRAYILSHNNYSRSAYLLAKGLKAPRVNRDIAAVNCLKSKIVINWGVSTTRSESLGYLVEHTFFNPVNVVSNVSGKKEFFVTMNGKTRTPDWTTKVEDALKWVSEGHTVCARTKNKASNGDGLVFFDKPGEFVKAPLFTKYIPKKEEYRVHYGFGELIDIQRKVLRTHDEDGEPIDPSTVDFKVRNHANGFIFQRHNLQPPNDVLVQAEKAYKASGLHFGAFDVIYNSKQDKAYVLEVNTAPGLEGETVDNYINMFTKALVVA